MAYWFEMDLLSVGFRDGKIQSFLVTIELEEEQLASEYYQEEDNYYSNEDTDKYRFSSKWRARRPRRNLDGTVLMKKAFE